jgi:pimeloyl-ACP methyl ester carboxylesterase
MVGRMLSRRSTVGLLREVRGLATHIALYPLGLFDTPLRAHEEPSDGDTLDLPIVLVHGYFHNRSGFFLMARALRREGFRYVYGMNYNPLGESVSSLSARLAQHVEDVLAVSGAPRVHLVGHSLGGVIARWYVQEMGGASAVERCVTIGTPHAGTYAAYCGLGQTAREMRPGSDVVRRLERGFVDGPTRYLNLYSDLDVLIVPANSAILPDRTNVESRLISDLGHTSLLISNELISTVAGYLSSADVHLPLAEVRALSAHRAEGTDAAARP